MRYVLSDTEEEVVNVNMNLWVALAIVAGLGGFGGVVHGFLTYGGVLLPRRTHQQIPIGPEGNQRAVIVPMFLPGVLGQALAGIAAAFLVYGTYGQPGLVVGAKASVSLTLYDMAVALLAGLATSKVIATLVDNRQWSKLAPVLKQVDPDAAVEIQGMKPIQAAEALANTQ